MRLIFFIILIIYLIFIKVVFGSILLGLAITIGLGVAVYYHKQIIDFTIDVFDSICNTYQNISTKQKIYIVAFGVYSVIAAFAYNAYNEYVEEIEHTRNKIEAELYGAKVAADKKGQKDSIRIANKKRRIADSIYHITHKEYFDSINRVRKLEKKKQQQKINDFFKKKLHIYKGIYYGMSEKEFYRSKFYNTPIYKSPHTLSVSSANFYHGKLQSVILETHLEISRDYGKKYWDDETLHKNSSSIEEWANTNFKNSDLLFETYYVGRCGWRGDDFKFRFTIKIQPKESFMLNFK